MGTKVMEIDCSQLERFVEQMEGAANGLFKQEVHKFLEGIGDKFLEIVVEEIKRRNVMDTRLLLNSFQKGSEGGVWKTETGGMTLEIGTNVEYASYVNDGHLTNPEGVKRRWVPGYWNGDRFIYSPGVKTGMLLQQKWVEGAHYWEGAIRIIERMIPQFLEKKMAEWLSSYFGV